MQSAPQARPLRKPAQAGWGAIPQGFNPPVLFAGQQILALEVVGDGYIPGAFVLPFRLFLIPGAQLRFCDSKGLLRVLRGLPGTAPLGPGQVLRFKGPVRHYFENALVQRKSHVNKLKT